MQHRYTMSYGKDKVAISEVDLGIIFDSEIGSFKLILMMYVTEVIKE